jgi:NAD(P)-dependent dehydrogenase (short-subunit alcohol dehydrogenase family)
MSVLDLFRLDGKRAMITGGTRGLGRAMAQAFAEAGADLVLVSRDAGHLQQAKGELSSLGRRVGTVQADLTSPAATEQMCAQALDQHGPIHILVNNVGGRRENVRLEDQLLSSWQKLIDLNLTSAVVCTKAIGTPMVQRGKGRIINISSICGQIATRSISGRHYETAKAGLAGFTRAIAADWASRGVTVNAIAPGGFLTDANAAWFRERPEFREQIESMIPMGRMGNPEEIGPLAVFLASDASSYMTGSIIVMDGGKTLW